MFMNLSALQLFAWLSTDDYVMPGAFRVYTVSVYPSLVVEFNSRLAVVVFKLIFLARLHRYSRFRRRVKSEVLTGLYFIRFFQSHLAEPAGILAVL